MNTSPEELFYDAGNLQPLCKSCHDRKTAMASASSRILAAVF
ncbi:MAG: HNH endonuclease [Tepidanaerobacter acetatoxydans]|nr:MULTISPECIES: HNH endonuclease signature motif containing protein [Tepidanaerobacter]NLU09739.1 HNH endonuclease [Tepidanaerobacter acetatoxydans]